MNEYTRISDLIAELQELLAEHGNLRVYAFDEYESGTSCRHAHASFSEDTSKDPKKGWIQIHN